MPLAVLLGAGGSRFSSQTVAAALHPSGPGHSHETWTIERTRPLSRRALVRFASGLGKDIYRAKGFVRLRSDPGRRYVYQQVGARWSLEAGENWGNEPRRTCIVVIGHRGAAGAEALETLLDKVPSGRPTQTYRPL